MFALIKESWQAITIAIVAAVLFAGMGVFSPALASTQADQISSLMSLVAKLQEQVRQMQAKAGITQGADLMVGATIATTDTVRVRSNAGTVVPTSYTQPAGVNGKITEGPQVANGYTWYRVDFEGGADGWVASNWIKSQARAEASITKPADDSKVQRAVCVNGDKSYPEGTKRTSIVNADGTTTSIMDAHFVCRIVDGKGVWVKEVSSPKTATKITCTNGTDTYPEGTKRTSLINADGTTTSIMDAHFVCRNMDGKGVWVKEESLPKPAKPTDTSVVTCTNGADTYPEGTKRTSLINADGTTTSIMDAYFVCRGGKNGSDGTWVKEGSLPKPKDSSKITCTNGTDTYPEGTKRTSIVNADGTTTSIMDAHFVCRAGKDGSTGVWAKEGSMPKSSKSPSANVRGVSIDVFSQIAATLTALNLLLTELE